MAIQSHLLPSITYLVLVVQVVQLVQVVQVVHIVLQQNKVENHYTTVKEIMSSK